MAHLDHPAPGLLLRFSPLDVGFLAAVDDLRNVAVVLDGAQVLRAEVARVGAQMLVSPMWRALALDDDGSEHLIKPLTVMDFGPVHAERRRMAVHTDSKKQAVSQSRKRWWMALALPDPTQRASQLLHPGFLGGPPP